MDAIYSDIWYQSADTRLQLYARDYKALGGGSGMPVLCMHGLTRNSADFEWIAAHLAKTYRVISVDQRGRGKSQWDDQPANYAPGVYVQDMFKLLAELGITRTAIIGTSMGGLMAMIMGSFAPQAIAGMVINDVGPELDPAGLKRIAGYTGKGIAVATWQDAAARARETNAVAFPDYHDDDWLAFARRTYEVRHDGSIAPAYDPAIAQAFATPEPTVAPPDLWGLWDKLEGLPLLAVRGEISDLLSAHTLKKMGERHAGMKAVTVRNRGHAPMLDEGEAVTAIETFLQGLKS
ncbi:alpha/beta fold hydrolase [Asticcacaulis sp. AC402]|uniref:alpha/beta fold hydrolase n=1 Tax=Asticcacaulis sp. AC402 TaxID=1282361 RepID=UPI0003C40D42|nr:alpha/beta hydrolase [Asticcacaulis sp. AC402]ESQ74092.1 alpha/beta hydrolase [Asticcacaulis sp. AC402]